MVSFINNKHLLNNNNSKINKQPQNNCLLTATLVVVIDLFISFSLLCLVFDDTYYQPSINMKVAV